MGYENFFVANQDGHNLCLYKWTPKDKNNAAGIVQIAHGMAEWAGRYNYFAEKLTEAGYIVYAHDHRGHGKTAKDAENIGFLGEDGFNGMVRDLRLVHNLINEKHPDLPVILFGHSMGSFLAQSYICQYGNILKGVILSGSNGEHGSILNLGILIAKIQMMLFGSKAKSKLLNSITFGLYNKPFKPCRTPFGWLSRDASEVDKYIGDPYCGGIFTTSFFYDFFKGLKTLHDPYKLDQIPKSLPILILSGSRDPVSEFGNGVARLAESYRKLGLTDVTLKIYEKARHELLNELNKDEVIADIIHWLKEKN